jgi:hypothetical protein
LRKGDAMGVAQSLHIPKTVRLSQKPHEAPHTEPEDVVITMDERVKWDYPGDFVVVFETETPFDSWYFYPGNSVSSTPRPDVEHNHPYKYSVHIDGKRRDPNVIIRP